MKITSCTANNFGSYKHFEWNYADQGLVLIEGATGSGKSTLQDIPYWVLFGKTPKNVKADHVRHWGATDEPTTGTLCVEIDTSSILITRIRGKTSENDLYWTESGNDYEKVRGKDITETQKLLNQRLGIDSTLYSTIAYSSEFAPISAFFIASAQERRLIFEKIANLEFPTKLAAKLQEKKKHVKYALESIQTDLATTQGRIKQATLTVSYLKKAMEEWDISQIKQIELYQAKALNFEAEKASAIAALTTRYDAYESQRVKKIEELQTKLEHELQIKLCDKCGRGPKSNAKLLKDTINELQTAINPHKGQLDQTKTSVNTYNDRINTEKNKTNVFTPKLLTAETTLAELKTEFNSLENSKQVLEQELKHIQHLQELALELRGNLLLNSVANIQQETNRILATYFDGMFRVELNLADPNADQDLYIFKDANECTYAQLSKGQRQLLKLSFTISVMKTAANQATQCIKELFFDEALDGLDATLKEKAFPLFQELALTHSSVYVIDHSEELKELFDTKVHVKLINGESVVTVNEA